MTVFDIKNLKAAKRYACALLALNNSDKIQKDMESVCSLFFENSDFTSFFEHPVISITDKKDTLKEIFDGKVDNEMINLLYVLIDNNRFNILPSICEIYKKESQKRQNIVSAAVSSAVELSDEEKETLNDKLNKKLNKKVILDFNIDKEIIAGLVIKIEDNVIDLSLKSKFDKLKKA